MISRERPAKGGAAPCPSSRLWREGERLRDRRVLEVRGRRPEGARGVLAAVTHAGRRPYRAPARRASIPVGRGASAPEYPSVAADEVGRLSWTPSGGLARGEERSGPERSAAATKAAGATDVGATSSSRMYTPWSWRAPAPSDDGRAAASVWAPPAVGAGVVAACHTGALIGATISPVPTGVEEGGNREG